MAALKITQEHQAIISGEMAALLKETPYAEHREVVVLQGKAKDIDMRTRWDFFYALPQSARKEFTDAVYPYANDDHIDSVLKHLVK